MGHLLRHEDESASRLVTWRSTAGRVRRGRPARTYVDQLENDAGLPAAEFAHLADDCQHWASIVARTYVDQLENDAGLPATEFAHLAKDRQHWASIVVGRLTQDD